MRKNDVRRALAAALFTVLVSACDSDPVCTPGAASCACAPASRCDDGLVCSDGVCGAPTETSLIIPTAARACEVLLRDGSGEVTGARFGPGVTGTHVREAPRTALSFAATPDSAIGEVRVQLVGDASTFSIESSRCFDGAGTPLSDSVRVGG